MDAAAADDNDDAGGGRSRSRCMGCLSPPGRRGESPPAEFRPPPTDRGAGDGEMSLDPVEDADGMCMAPTKSREYRQTN